VLSRAVSFLVLISFFKSPLISTASGQMDGESLYEAASSHIRAIRSFDVQVTHWAFFHPASNGDPNEAAEVEKSTRYRLIMDHDKERCFFLQNKGLHYSKSELSKDDIALLASTWTFEYYDKGERIDRSLESTRIADKSKKMDFQEFCKWTPIPAPDMIGLIGQDAAYNIPKEKRISTAIAARNDSSVKMFPDGTARITDTFQIPDGSKRTLFLTLSPKNWEAIKFIGVREKNGKQETTYDQNSSYEVVDGISRPIRISYSKESFGSGIGKDGFKKRIIYDEVGTVELTWLQMNDEAMVLPNIGKLARDIKLWNDFIGPETNSKTKK